MEAGGECEARGEAPGEKGPVDPWQNDETGMPNTNRPARHGPLFVMRWWLFSARAIGED